MNIIKYKLLTTLENSDSPDKADLLNAVRAELGVTASAAAKHFDDLVFQGLIKKSHPESRDYIVTSSGRDSIYQHEFLEEQRQLLLKQVNAAVDQADSAKSQAESAKSQAESAKSSALTAKIIAVISTIISIISLAIAAFA